jgi:cytochrome c oxidase cbb3-type subunit 1
MYPALTTTTDQDMQQRAEIDRSLRHPVMFFLTSGAAWLAFSLLFGVIASAKVHHPGFLANHSWLTYGRVFPAHINALLYGWGMQAAFAMILWLMARLSRKECTAAGTILTAGCVWNLGVALGITGILSGNGTGMPWLEFPSFAWPVLLVSYFAIVVWPFIQFRVRPQGLVPISQWYILAAVIWFPWIFITANMLLHCLPGHPLMAAGINAWYKSALVFLFFTPVAVGTAYELALRETGRPLFSDSLAKLGFWSLAIIAPWAGMQKLAGVPVAYFLPYVGAAATALLFIPVCAAATNTIRTIAPSRETFDTSAALSFTTAGMICLVILAVSLVLLNLPDSTLPLTQFSLSGYAMDIFALYGFFSLVMFGAAYFIVPRVTGRDWLSSRLITLHFLFSVYGMITVFLVTLLGGLQQGLGQEDWRQPWMVAVSGTNPYAVATTFAWCLILFSNVFFFLHLILMWLRVGRHAFLPAQPGSAHGSIPDDEAGASDHAAPHHATAHSH